MDNVINCDILSSCFGNGVVPASIEPIFSSYYFYNREPFTWPVLKASTLFDVSTIKNPVLLLNEIVKRDTQGWVSEVDPSIADALRHPAFKDLYYAILFMKGRWFASKCGIREFHNADCKIVKVPFIKFQNVKFTINNNVLTAEVIYDLGDNNYNKAYFVMPYQYQNCEGTTNLIVPEVCIRYRREIKLTNGGLVVDCMYRHDKNGFTALALCGMYGTGLMPTSEIVMDKPFKIKIMIKNDIVFDISVNKLG